jgi:diadenosine tetraphosphate (Ap4A) HIT family hydrolase
MTASKKADCPFCDVAPERLLGANAHAVAVFDAYPVSPGHTLVVARRHLASFFDLTPSEVSALHELLFEMQLRLQATHAPQGYNVGVNVGTVAGQTIMHVHLHLIPRYLDDVPDPVGGIRNVIPGRGRYA